MLFLIVSFWQSSGLLLKKDFCCGATIIDIVLLNKMLYVDMVLMFLDDFTDLFQFAYLRISSLKVVL